MGRVLQMIAAEHGASKNTRSAYARDLAGYACAREDAIIVHGEHIV